MFNYFLNKDITHNTGIRQYPGFGVVKEKYLLDINRIEMYYETSGRAVSNSHLLARLLDNLILDISIDVIDYYKYLKGRVDYICRQFELTNNSSYGKVHKCEIYNGLGYEAYMVVEQDLPIMELESCLHREPIKVLHTNNTRLDLHIPYREFKLDDGITIFEIDLVLMGMMYREWVLKTSKTESSTDSSYFVSKVLLPKLAKHILDYSIWNRLVSYYNGKKLDKSIDRKHPFVTFNLTKEVDKVIVAHYKDFNGNLNNLDKLLGSIPMVYNKNAKELLHTDSRYHTVQSKWLHWLSRIGTITTLFKLLGKRGIKNELTYMNRLPVVMKLIDSNESRIENSIPEHIYEYFLKNKKIIERVAGKR